MNDCHREENHFLRSFEHGKKKKEKKKEEKKTLQSAQTLKIIMANQAYIAYIPATVIPK